MRFSLAEVPLPLRLRTAVPMSDDELLRFCAVNESVRVERDANGDLSVMSPAGSESSGRNSEIIGDLVSWARRDGRGKVFDSNGGFTLPDGSMLAPDAAWIAYPRWNALTRDEQKRFAPICPDFIIELRSPTDSLPALEAKMELWIANGAELAWLIDPMRKVVSIYSPARPIQHMQDPMAVHGQSPIEGFILPLTEIWK
jgi:Uma2 family endonuclease